MKRRDEFFENRTNQPAPQLHTAPEAPLLSSNTLCTYPPNSLSTPLVHTAKYTDTESIWCTKSASEHTEKMYMFQLIRTYLCVYTSLCPAHFIQTERRSRASRHIEEHVVLALIRNMPYITQQKERSEHDKDYLRLCTEPKHQ